MMFVFAATQNGITVILIFNLDSLAKNLEKEHGNG